jgi:hypothetical protein
VCTYFICFQAIQGAPPEYLPKPRGERLSLIRIRSQAPKVIGLEILNDIREEIFLILHGHPRHGARLTQLAKLPRKRVKLRPGPIGIPVQQIQERGPGVIQR